MSRLSLFLAASVGAFLSANHAHAATCVPTPLAPCPSDSIQITDGNGHVLNDINGKPASAVINEGDPSEGVSSLFFDFAVPPPAGLTLPTDVELLETAPNPNGLTPSSDSVELKSIATGIEILFASDSETTFKSVNCSIGVFTCIAETGQAQDVTALLFPGVAAPPFHVTVQSDPAEVPEPGTLLLLGTGVAGLIGIGARRQRV